MTTEEVLVELYTKATDWAMKNNQVTGEKRDYFITLNQLESFMKTYLYKEDNNE